MQFTVVAACAQSSESARTQELGAADGPVAVELEVAVPPPPVFRAKDILVPELLHGENYEIAERVTLRNFTFHFKIRTPWGTIPVDGMTMLGLRLREMMAVERILAMQDQNPQYVTGLVDEVQQVPIGAKALLWWPDKTLVRAPLGVRRTVESRLHRVNRNVGSNTRRRLAAEIGCDPETLNPVLQPMLDKAARMRSLGSLTSKGTMIAVSPAIAVLAMLGRFEESVAAELPHQSNKRIDGKLRMIGVDDETRRQFLESTTMTTAQRLTYVEYLCRLRGPEDLSAVVRGAVDASCEGDALGAVVELKLLGELPLQSPIARFEYTGLPMAVLEDGTHVVVTSADLIVEKPELVTMIDSYRYHFPIAPTLFITAGRISVGARQMFAAAAITVIENGGSQR